MYAITRTHWAKCRHNETGTMRNIQSLWDRFLFEVMGQGERKKCCQVSQLHSQVIFSPCFHIHSLSQIPRGFHSNSESKNVELYQPGEQWFPESHIFGHIYVLLSISGVTVLCFSCSTLCSQFCLPIGCAVS